MKTAGLVKISPSRDVTYTSAYNLQGKKTDGSWRDDPTHLTQRNLISFCGNSNLPGLTVQQHGSLFIDQSEHNLELAQRVYPHGTVARHKNWSSCHTIIQSFEYRANKDLKPTTVHAMGEDLFRQVKSYLNNYYGYTLDNGLISTHIDRAQLATSYNPKAKIANREPHLHNHIVIPDYNAVGEPIYPYMRKADLYRYQQFNDNIVLRYGLNDFYFDKLNRQIRPESSYTLNNNNKRMRSSDVSNLERSLRAFKTANDYTWDKYKPTPVNLDAVFPKMVKFRDDYLVSNYYYKSKKTHDSLNKKPKRVFTARVFVNKVNLDTQWYNINNMRLLRWRTKKEMKAERVLWQLKFSRNILNTCTSFGRYQQTLKIATRGVPDVDTLTSPAKRKSHVYDLDNAYQIACNSETTVTQTRETRKVDKVNDYQTFMKQEGYRMYARLNPKQVYHDTSFNYLREDVINVANDSRKYRERKSLNESHHQKTSQPSIRPQIKFYDNNRSKSRHNGHDNTGRER